MAKEQQRTVYTTARGKQVDLHKLIAQNELTPAVGNAKVNARGDKLGAGGQIIQRKEQLTRIPDEISPRPEVVSPVVESTPAPVAVAKPVAPTVIIPKKNVKDMDPEGNE
jgi:hypothetical protein